MSKHLLWRFFSLFTLSKSLLLAGTVYTDPAVFAQNASIFTSIDFNSLVPPYGGGHFVAVESPFTFSGFTFSNSGTLYILGQNFGYYPLASAISSWGSSRFSVTLPLNGSTALAFSFGGPVTGDVVAATFLFSDGTTFDAIVPIAPSLDFLGITSGTPITSMNVVGLSGVFSLGNISVGEANSSIPEPSTGWLVVAGYLALGAWIVFHRRAWRRECRRSSVRPGGFDLFGREFGRSTAFSATSANRLQTGNGPLSNEITLELSERGKKWNTSLPACERVSILSVTRVYTSCLSLLMWLSLSGVVVCSCECNCD